MRARLRLQLYAVQLISLALALIVGLYAIGQVQRLSQKRAASYASASFNQAVQSISTLLDAIRGAAQGFCYSAPVQELLLTPKEDKLRLKEVYGLVLDNVRFTAALNQTVMDVALVPEKGEPYLFGSYITSSISRSLVSYYEGLGEGGGQFTGFLQELCGGEFAYALPVYAYAPGERYAKRIGICLFLCRTSTVMDVLGSALLDGVSLAVDHDGGGRLYAGDAAQWRLEQALRNQYAFPRTRWTLVQFGAAEGGLPPTILLLIFIPIALCACLLLLLVVHRNITLPIMQINAQLMQIASDPGGAAPIHVTTRNELSSIAALINHMLEQVHAANQRSIRSQKRLLEAELLQKKSQLSALQSQINPHFLYNTLGCIRGMALEGERQAVADIASNMATLFRYSIKGGAFVRICEEVAITKKYLDIMNTRMNNKFHVTFDIPQVLAQSWMVKMMLQPLVENAVFHGLECLDRDGVLRLSARFIDADSYEVTIEDNGVGMPPDMVERIAKSLSQGGNRMAGDGGMSIGILNIDQKIKLHVGDRYGLTVRSALGKGTTVKLTMPYLKQPPQGG